ncbi:MAG: MDR/zinc-dependent alcohol dehydrogenase-like family protein [Acidimicrobiales bacterium]
MSDQPWSRALQMRSLVTKSQTVEVSLEEVEVPEPEAHQVLIRVEAAPINPSDLGLLFAGADLTRASASGPADRPVLVAPLADGAARAAAGRVGQSMPVGNEGAGTVVAAGDSDAARTLLGKVVAVAGGAMYSQYRTADAGACLELPEGTRPAEGAASFVNPMTVLGMVETMGMEGHTALAHTAAASNLGQMLNRVCIQEQVPLVNIVRSPAQASLLRDAGAAHVCDSSTDGFMEDLVEAFRTTSATLAFDAIGGGSTASQILAAMEAAISSGTEFSRYGSAVHKQVYLYGGLDRGPTELARNYGMAWGIGGWLLTSFLQRAGPERTAAMRRRVADGITTTFASHFDDTVSLAQALHLDAISVYSRQATGKKYLIDPTA